MHDDAVYARLRKVHAEFADDLHKLPGVTGSAIGYKTTGGIETRDLALVIFVGNKTALPGNDPAVVLIGKIVARGCLTDVVVVRRGSRELPMAKISGADAGRKDKTDPMIGGLSVGPDVSILKDPSDGTLGLAVRRSDGNLGILSNQHVLYYDVDTKTVCQPARIDSFRNYTAGNDLTCVKGTVPLDGVSTYVDCGVATVLADRTAATRKVFDLPDVTGIVPYGDVKVGDTVRKSGLASGVTTGTVKYIAMAGPGGDEPNQFAIVGNGGKTFGEAGDSGSVVVIDDKVMGLLWGENEVDGLALIVVSPIEAVLTALDVAI